MTKRAGPLLARWRPLLATLVVLGLTVASGTLECQPLVETRSVAHGREIYGRMCAVCHGAGGEGYKADQAPALHQPEFLASVTDAALTAAITQGRAGSTMSSWGLERGGPLAPADVAAVVEFLRTWQALAAPPFMDDRPAEGDLGRGATLFAAECATCHGKRGTGGPQVSVGNPQLLSTVSNGFLRLAVEDGRGGTPMPAFRKKLGDQGVEDVVALLRSWQTAVGPDVPRLAAPARPPPLPLGPVPLNPNGPEPNGFKVASGFVSADVVAAELRRGARMAILDARAPPDYTGEHIAGAVSVPFYDPDPYVSALPKDAWLVCYCGCPHAESGQLAQKLRGKGFTKVTVIDEGLRYWVTKKYATRAGTLP